jgi:hypothetical protein
MYFVICRVIYLVMYLVLKIRKRLGIENWHSTLAARRSLFIMERSPKKPPAGTFIHQYGLVIYVAIYLVMYLVICLQLRLC